jgi:uncharacterized protein
MHVTSLHLHPVKSFRGLSVETASVDELGIVGDRRFLVTEPGGRLLTQRTVPAMARVGAFLDSTSLILRSEGFAEIRVRREPDPGAKVAVVQVWNSVGLQAEDCGDPVADWLSDFLKTPCRLARIGPAFERPVHPDHAKPGDRVGFADAYPLLIASEASLLDLNQRMAATGSPALPMNRFRPNIVVSGCGPFAEDTLVRFRIGKVVFRAANPCIRCIMTTTDQLTGERGKEPLRTLATYRRSPNDPTHLMFGFNLVNETKSGDLRVGDPVEVL